MYACTTSTHTTNLTHCILMSATATASSLHCPKAARQAASKFAKQPTHLTSVCRESFRKKLHKKNLKLFTWELNKFALQLTSQNASEWVSGWVGECAECAECKKLLAALSANFIRVRSHSYSSDLIRTALGQTHNKYTHTSSHIYALVLANIRTLFELVLSWRVRASNCVRITFGFTDQI